MNISSIILHAVPECLDEIRTALAGMPGVEIHAASKEGKLVLTLEDSGTGSASESYIALHHIPGVLSVAMVYQYSDDDLEMQEMKE